MRNKIWEHSDQLLARTFEAVLAVVVIWAGESYLKTNIRRCRNTFQDTHKRDTVRNSSLYFLMTKDPEIVPGNILSKDRES